MGFNNPHFSDLLNFQKQRLKRIAAQSNAMLLKSGGALIWNTSADDVDACERILTKGCMAAIYAAVCDKASIIPRKTACKMWNQIVSVC